MKQRQHFSRRAMGFSLIELMITVAIVAILASIAYPSYQNHMTRTYRKAAVACMGQYAQFMERYYTTILTYVGVGTPTMGCMNEGNLSQRYTLAVDTLAQGTYRVTATPIGVQATRDTLCGVLTVNQAAVRTEGGSAASPSECF